MTLLRAEIRLGNGAWLLRASNGVSFVAENLSVTGSAGTDADGWWLRCLRGRNAGRRYLDFVREGASPPEWHEVGTFPTLRDAKRAVLEHSRQARRERVA